MLTAVKTERLLVSRQDPETRRFGRVGVLTCDDVGGYRFDYDIDATRALPGLALGVQHESQDLFPIFAERIMHSHRPDRVRTLEQLGLKPDAGPFEVLAISGGRRTGDTYELTPLPEPGPVDLPFLVHGIRHLTRDEQARVDTLTPGQSLALVPEPTNEVNERAVLVTEDGWRLGYVPDPLLDFVHPIIGKRHSITVVRVNEPGAGLHMRLLVKLAGTYTG